MPQWLQGFRDSPLSHSHSNLSLALKGIAVSLLGTKRTRQREHHSCRNYTLQCRKEEGGGEGGGETCRELTLSHLLFLSLIFSLVPRQVNHIITFISCMCELASERGELKKRELNVDH